MRMAADIEAFGARTLVVLSADHVFNMDLAPVVDEHVSAGRVATVLTSEVTKKDATDNVVVLARGDKTVTGVEHKPSRPSAGTVASEVFVYDTEALMCALRTCAPSCRERRATTATAASVTSVTPAATLGRVGRSLRLRSPVTGAHR